MKKEPGKKKARPKRTKKQPYQPPRLVELENLKGVAFAAIGGTPSHNPASSSPAVPGMVVF